MLLTKGVINNKSVNRVHLIKVHHLQVPSDQVIVVWYEELVTRTARKTPTSVYILSLSSTLRLVSLKLTPSF